MGNEPKEALRSRSPLLFKRPRGFFQCRRAVRTLERFQNLLRHHKRYAGEMTLACPLEELFPGLDPEAITPPVLEQAIKRLMPVATIALRRAGIHTAFVATEESLEYDYEHKERRPKKKEIRIDVVEEYLRLPYKPSYFDLAIETLDKGIGFYSAEQKRAFWRMFNPLVWIAEVLHAPVFVLQHAGLLSDETPSAVVKTYLWILRLLLLALVGLCVTWVAKKLGVNVPLSFLKP